MVGRSLDENGAGDICCFLAVIAWKLPFADVGHAQMGTCGSTKSAPCHISVTATRSEYRSLTHRTFTEAIAAQDHAQSLYRTRFDLSFLKRGNLM